MTERPNWFDVTIDEPPPWALVRATTIATAGSSGARCAADAR
jgi:hypothetical protein